MSESFFQLSGEKEPIKAGAEEETEDEEDKEEEDEEMLF